MVFVKGYKQNKLHKLHSKKARFAKYGEKKCIVCGEKFLRYKKEQVLCGKNDCRLSYTKMKYDNTWNEDPINAKAIRLFSTIRLGKGKKEISYKILKDNLGKPCKYCGEIINYDNASVDHIIPRTGSKVHSRKTNSMTYTKEEIKELDKKENLQIICRNCNQTKSDFTDEEFLKLLNFLKNEEKIKEKLFKRLKYTRVFFGFKR